jgi:hypothetical protein
VWGDSIVMITWKEGVALTFDLQTLELRHTARYGAASAGTTTGEGWGITADHRARRLIVSDGSPYLHFWDPAALPEIRQMSPPVMVRACVRACAIQGAGVRRRRCDSCGACVSRAHVHACVVVGVVGVVVVVVVVFVVSVVVVCCGYCRHE